LLGLISFDVGSNIKILIFRKMKLYFSGISLLIVISFHCKFVSYLT
jgi:hypothetical protein